MAASWDYLILTASNDRQALGYESQLAVRRQQGLLEDVGNVLVVADPLGRRVGSGGSTLYCLMRVVELEMARRGSATLDWPGVEQILRGLRILILHAGGDSRRVPAYGPCGKIFSPLPGTTGKAVISTLFDRLLPLFRRTPRGPSGAGQVVVAAGDAVMIFDPESVRLDRPGIVALGAGATPEAASKHGVFCLKPDGDVRLFLQKPSRADQVRYGAINAAGETILDIAVMSFDAAAAVAMFRAFDVVPAGARLAFAPDMEKLILDRGLDLYREISCALGSEATAEHHRISCQASGSSWPADRLATAHEVLSKVPVGVDVLAQCAFLHFGTTRQLITSGKEMLEHDGQPTGPTTCLAMNNRTIGPGRINGGDGWVEGCRLAAPLGLAGQNVVVGVDVDAPLELPAGACLDVIAGQSPGGVRGWFVRCYHVADTFKDTVARGGTLAGRPLAEWLAAAGASAEQAWDPDVSAESRSLWDAKVFPLVASPGDFRDWLWMFDPARATADQRAAFAAAERFSVAQIALLADMDAFYRRRTQFLGD